MTSKQERIVAIVLVALLFVVLSILLSVPWCVDNYTGPSVTECLVIENTVFGGLFQ